MKKTMWLTYILEHTSKRDREAETRDRNREEGNERRRGREEKKGRNIRAEVERWVGRIN